MYQGVTLPNIGSDILNARELLYPFLWWDFSGTTYTIAPDSRGISYKLYNMSLTVLGKAVPNAAGGLTKDVMSDAEQILADVVQILSTSPELKQFRINQANISLTPTIDENKDGVEGWTCVVPFKIPYTFCYTSLPITDFSTVTPFCKPGRINVNGTFSSLVQSGADANLTIVDTAGTQVGTETPTGSGNFVVPVGSAGVYYARAQYLDDQIVREFDEAWYRANRNPNAHNDSIPIGAQIQRINYNTTLRDQLVFNNIHGHTNRFTGYNVTTRQDTGGYYDWADGEYKDVNGNLSDKDTEFPTYAGNRFLIIDHYTGRMYIGVRLGITRILTALQDVENLTDAGFSDWENVTYGTAVMLSDNRYNNSLGVDRPPWAYDQTQFWTCTNTPGQRTDRVIIHVTNNTTGSGTIVSTTANRWPTRVHYTGRIS